MIQDIEIIFKDYTNRLSEKLNDKNDVININNMINFFNWCFYHKNNFLVNKFNVKYLKNVCDVYNLLKSNILRKGKYDIFENIPLSELKRIKFILNNYVNNYNSIKEDNSNTILCEFISKESILSSIKLINFEIKLRTNNIISKI